MSRTVRDAALSVATASLLRGVVYESDHPKAWEAVAANEGAVRDHVSVLGLRLVLDDVERYAFLRTDEDLAPDIPRLVRRHALSYHATVLLILLRQRLADADADTGSPRAVVTLSDLVDQARLYYRDGTLEDKIAGDISKLENDGFLRKMRVTPTTYEIRRVLKSVVTGEFLAEYRDRLLQPDAVGASSGLDGDADTGALPGLNTPAPGRTSATVRRTYDQDEDQHEEQDEDQTQTQGSLFSGGVHGADA